MELTFSQHLEKNLGTQEICRKCVWSLPPESTTFTRNPLSKRFLEPPFGVDCVGGEVTSEWSSNNIGVLLDTRVGPPWSGLWK